MDVITLTYLTGISLALAIVAIVLSMFLVRNVRSKNVMSHKQESLYDVVPIVEEFTQRLRKLEDNLVEQRVRMEIVDLRMKRELSQSGGMKSEELKVPEIGVESGHGVRVAVRRKPALDSFEEKSKLASSGTGVGSTERVVLEIVRESQGGLVARDIQQRIGKSREHTARLMNSLFQEGFVVRNMNRRPFSYSITEKGMEYLSTK